MYLSVCGKYGNEKSMLSGNKCEQRLFFFKTALCKHKAKMAAVKHKCVHMLIYLAVNVC